MIRFVLTRLGAMVVIMIALIAVMFILAKVSPLDPVHAQLGAQASAQAVAERRHALGLDRPMFSQFLSYLGNVAHGDFGTSYRTRRPVSTDIADFLPATLELAFMAIVISIVMATLLAFSSVLKWPGARLFRGILYLGSSAPMFLLGIIGLIVFYQRLGWVPANGRTSLSDAPTGPTGFLVLDGLIHARFDVIGDALHHLILPAFVIALGPAVAIGRVLQSSLAEDAGSEYVKTARAKGLGETRILFGHVLRNSLGAALSMTGLQIGLMLSGVLVVEQVFGWPGIGQYIAQSIPVADFPAISGVTIVLGGAYVVINAIVDLLQAAADPRIVIA
ncbi:ABC transporter permease [Gordonia jinhuaensis]|uniref:Peptide ABC transporter permease n=1 Tax=Gordonia jinhuaensis TaxID=1517702 RepID=A0A916T1X1_9ACTN|nr:ABC transporter permease [Gordonia jinhuaensis]GGB28462.1 peptide ABC transporter permease [Gordonia jinhuaensis]